MVNAENMSETAATGRMALVRAGKEAERRQELADLAAVPDNLEWRLDGEWVAVTVLERDPATLRLLLKWGDDGKITPHGLSFYQDQLERGDVQETKGETK